MVWLKPVSLPCKGRGRGGCICNKICGKYSFVAGILLFCGKFQVLMRPNQITYPFLTFILVALAYAVVAQKWDFIKEKDGIRIYTRKETGHALKSFKGVADINAPKEKVFNLVGNVKNLDWWDKNLREIKVLYYEKEKRSQYYLVYDSPWPVTDRDICSEALITTDSITGIRTIYSKPLVGAIPEKPDLVRIKDYWQRWTLEPSGKNMVHVELEGYVDPAGIVPDWIYNMVITDTPLKIIRGIKQRLELK